MPDTENRPQDESFSDQVYRLRERAQSLSAQLQANNVANTPLVQETLAELTVALDELQNAKERMRRQQLLLEETHATVLEERERYRSLFEAAPVAYIVTDLAGVVQHANQVAFELLSLGPKYLINKPIFAFVETPLRADLRQAVNRLQQLARIEGLETRFIPRHQPLVDVIVNITALYNNHNQPVGLTWIIQDITERKRRQEELRRLNEELEQRVAARTAHLNREKLEKELAYELEREARAEAEKANDLKLQFLAMVSHELRTPLTSIKGFASSLLAGDVTWSDAVRREFLETIDAESDRLSELVDQLLDLSRLKGGNLRVETYPCSYDTIIDQALAQLTAVTQHHRMVLDLPQRPPIVLADPRRTSQVLVNLIGNAAKFSEPGTTITLKCRHNDGLVETRVCDEGPGIPPDKREAVFEPFEQIDYRPGKRQGAGLGLAICKELVKAQGGDIWIEDTEVGTTLCFTLPVDELDGLVTGATE